MAGEALRRLYAEVGWKIDDAPLRRLDKILDDIKKSMLGGSVEKFEDDLEDATDDAKKLGKELAEADKEVKDLGKDMKKAGREMSSSLDDAGDKARRLKRETKDAGDEADRSRRKFQRFGDALNNISRSMTGGFWRMGTSLLRAPFSLPGMIIGGAATYGAVRYGLMNPLRMASEFEQAEIAFTTMLGSAEKAREFIDEMNRFAVETPFDVAGVQDAAKRMLAFGFRQEQIIPYLTAIGNAAAGLGGGTDLIDRISLAIGQMQAKSKVSAEEMLQLTEAGIPAWEILSQKMGKSTQELMKMTSNGLIPADKAIAMLIEGMNERFPDMLQKQADSLDGLKNQILETFNLVVVKRWGDGLARALKPRFANLNRWIEENDDKIQRWGSALEKTAFEGFDYLLRQGERAFEYIRSNYLENEEFQQLPFNKKIEYVFSDIERKITAWYNGGGKAKIEEGARKFVDFTIGVLEASVPQLTEIGIKLGKSIGAGLVSGFREVVKDHPIFSGLAAFVATPGSLPVKAGAAIAVTGQGFTDQAIEAFNESSFAKWNKDLFRSAHVWLSKNVYSPIGLTEDNAPSWADKALKWTSNQLRAFRTEDIPSHADGLPYVPKDNYIARLHEGERVLTKAENAAYTRKATQASASMPNVTINVNVSAAAASSGASTVREAAKQGTREGLEEFWRSMRMKYPAIREV